MVIETIMWRFSILLVVSLTARALETDAFSLTDRHGILPRDESFASLSRSNFSLFKRDDYACKKGKKCATNACCGSFFGGEEGVCGFGPTFCGKDCDSQCDAKPECGQYANPPGKTCPLNVCCSEFGFCGSTKDFCVKGTEGTGCQSNCDVDPQPPSGKSKTPVLSKVIGYYEAWSARRSCYPFPPSSLPVNDLTDVNFAFAYIDPSSLQITAMDSATPAELFEQTSAMKATNPKLKVSVSIGGWTFSDNGTATQAVFPSIARDAGKRKQFADNCVSFMKSHGFDGIDLDWEYPGAPDRGGSKDDTENYVELMSTLRSTFDAAGPYTISFTIPTSYWYLRWFDLPKMVKYADWINMMSYDLHGSWDATNPIGSIVQGHTNLTEIKEAAALLWRNDVPPSKVILGLGFYGRSFKLANPGCSTPGCAFSHAADPGVCTDSAGTLGYFEIMDIIDAQKPKITHDAASAVNYFSYGAARDQWISYDDAATFKQKLDWANSVGLGGVMVWTVDLDDTNFSALSGLLGKTVEPSISPAVTRAMTECQGGKIDASWQSYIDLNVADWFKAYSKDKKSVSEAYAMDFPNIFSEGVVKYRCLDFLQAKNGLTKTDALKAFVAYANPLMTGFF